MARDRKARRGAVERALGQILIGAVRSTRAHDDLNASMGFAEVEQQYQLPISGDASATPAFSAAEIEFDYPMHFAPGQRDSELDRPHFWFGAELNADIMVSAYVSEWAIDSDNGAYTGATVRVGVFADGLRSYAGRIHLTFQGWGALTEADSPEGS